MKKAEKEYIENYNKKSVLIIGAGPCGIISLKHLIDGLNVISIEGKDDIGGMWYFDPYTEQDHPNLANNAFYNQNGALPSSLYENLQANTPRCLMTFKGFPQKENYDEFMTSKQFMHYLQEFCSEYKLKQRMLFNTYVSKVCLATNLNQQERQEVGFEISKRFLVEIRDSNEYTKNVRYLQADSIIVASGHNSVPRYPQIKNSQLFTGLKSHTHNFRQVTIKNFTNKHLVIYGSSLSAQDIVYILLRKIPKEEQPKKITVIGNEANIDKLSQSTAYKEELQSNKLVFLSPYIKEFNSERSLVLQSDAIIEDIDCILYATGYIWKLPFLNFEKDKLIEFYNKSGRTNSFGPLYKRIFSVREPNLIFMGATHGVLSIQQQFEKQAICISRFLKEEIQLPSYEDMLADFNEDFESSNCEHDDGREYLKVSFSVAFNEIIYYNQLAQLAQLPVDEEFNNLIQEILLPPYFGLFSKGDYALLKSMDFSEKIPRIYVPKPGYL